MNALRRLYLVLFLALVLPLQSLAGSLLVGAPCPMSQKAAQLTDCCDEATMQAAGQLCPDMAKCPTAGLPLADSSRLTLKLLPVSSHTLLRGQVVLPSRPLAAPWRPPRA
ncbi:hypothetical protein PH586_20195 [Pseudomonas sp. SA3-5]|uniref:Uncharacterized protein n=1 Tax=Pseudomonas aestuarii TaxID=3018340 RepID=A0ABT4XKF2_9PSED|nr:hypothetical protein [Pseudomonas aestuarii]MDA7088706.1 hypothetical protein [Pseudomonas aestuarii]